MSKFLMFLTFLALPYYMLRAKWFLKFGNDLDKQKELKRYGDRFLSMRRKNVVCHGEENYLGLENCVFVSNHQSHNDIFILLSCLEKPFRFIAKKELFDSFIFKEFMKLSQSYPLDRDDDRASLMVLKGAVLDIKEEKASVVVFPEGTRSRGPQMNPFKTGLFSMLKRAKTAIVPVYIHESYLSDHKTFHVYFGKPIEDYSLKGPEIADMAFKTIERLQMSASKGS